MICLTGNIKCYTGTKTNSQQCTVSMSPSQIENNNETITHKTSSAIIKKVFLFQIYKIIAKLLNEKVILNRYLQRDCCCKKLPANHWLKAAPNSINVSFYFFLCVDWIYSLCYKSLSYPLFLVCMYFSSSLTILSL